MPSAASRVQDQHAIRSELEKFLQSESQRQEAPIASDWQPREPKG
jgi:hypothetical protein